MVRVLLSKLYVSGRLSSYITRGVSTVSGPFHPFGGAIDIVVVQQEDGSLKSSPWYVRFGKFQGVLKARERVVDINVNGVEADFHMFLNPRGEAYFHRDSADPEDKSLDINFEQCNSLINVNNSRSFSRNLGVVFSRKNVDHKEEDDHSNPNTGRRKSRESAEIAADLLEMKWSTTLPANSNDKNHVGDEEITSGKLESSLVLHEEHFVHNLEDEKNNTKGEKEVDKVIVANTNSDGVIEVFEKDGGLEENLPEPTEEPSKVVEEVNVVSVSVCGPEDEKDKIKSDLKSNGQLQVDSVVKKEAPEKFVEEQFVITELDDKNSCAIYHEVKKGVKGNLRKFPSDSAIARSYHFKEEETRKHTKSLPNLWSKFDEFNPHHIDDSCYCLDSKQRLSKADLLKKDVIKGGNNQLLNSQAADSKSKNPEDGTPSHIDDETDKSWSLWPFKRTKSKKFSPKGHECKKEADFDCKKEPDFDCKKEPDFDCGSEMDDHLAKHKHRELTPTSEQLESLNLSAGKNTVIFKFSTPVLGNQQVDARIFLWKWDTHIVISDVDGTITKSDVLGQFMPLVGRDWSHLGVTHLFSAIKDNGYEIMFLSARSISQADITRQFLINLRQEGKALPEGPVVISPDGLFPSLFREVIRRAPHEFKIACLADIRACFPDHWNPFYAGFGNRDTDEFSYLKVGIAKAKIFIINPKGEVVVNRCVDTNTYSSLHTVVNGIFPPVNKEAHERALARMESERRVAH